MIVLGNNIIRTSVRVSKSAVGGFRTVTEYEGTLEAVNGYAFQLPGGLDWAIDDSEKPKFRLIVAAPYLTDVGNTTPEAPTDTWELPGTASTKDIYEQKLSLALGSTVLSAVKRAVEKASSSSAANTAYGEAAGDITEATTAGAQRASALDLFDGILRGTTHYQLSQYTLKHTRAAGQNIPILTNQSGVEKVYSVSQIYAEEAALGSLMPAAILSDINAIEAPPAQDGYTWGWLKQAPSKKVAFGGRVEAVSEWILEQWWNRLYPNK